MSYYYEIPGEDRHEYQTKAAAIHNAQAATWPQDTTPTVHSPTGRTVWHGDAASPTVPTVRMNKENSVRRSTRIHRPMAAWLASLSQLEGRPVEQIIHDALLMYQAKYRSDERTEPPVAK